MLEFTMRGGVRIAMIALALTVPMSGRWAQAQPVSFEVREGDLDIAVAGRRVATYVWEDAAIMRPYFMNVRAPDGQSITRNHPPDPQFDRGNDDHATFHPGVWLAFGDLSGADFWRNRAAVRHVGFVVEPRGGDASGQFEVRNRYETLDEPPRVIGEEHAAYRFRVVDHGYLLECKYRFTPVDDDAAFGDQEEMGLGIRLATPLTVKSGNGWLMNSEGGRDEVGTWGRQARWCAGGAEVDGVTVGAVVMPAPGNFRPAWYHARDYGLIVANPFGKKSMTAPRDAEVAPESTPATDIRLGFAVGFFSTAEEPAASIEALYAAYVQGR